MVTFNEVDEFNVLGTGTAFKPYSEDATTVLTVKRTTTAPVLTGTSTGGIRVRGVHTSTATRNYRIEIDTDGDETSATYKWSNDGGSTFVRDMIPVSSTGWTLLEDGLYVLFGLGTYVLTDIWNFTAIALGSQVYSLAVDTTNNLVQVGDTLEVVDSSFTLDFQSATPQITFDTNDYIRYSRSGNIWTFVINAAVVAMQLSATSLVIGDPVLLGLQDTYLEFAVGTFTTPSVPSAGISNFYALSDDRPYWQTSVAEYPMLLGGTATNTSAHFDDGITFGRTTAYTTSPTFMNLTAALTISDGANSAFVFASVTSSIANTTAGFISLGYYHAPTIKNSGAVALMPTFAFRDSGTINITAHTATVGNYTSFHSNPTTSRTTSGTLTLTSMYQYHAAAPTIGANTIVTTRYGLKVENPSNSGTLTTNIGIDVDLQTAGTTDISIRNSGDYHMAEIAAPGTPAAGYINMVGFGNATGVTNAVPRFYDDGGHDSAPSMRVKEIVFGTAAPAITTAQRPTTTLGFTGQVKLEFGCMISQLFYNIGGAGVVAAGAPEIRIAMYSDDGASSVLISNLNAVDAPGTATGVRNVNVTDTYLPAGQYRTFVCAEEANGTWTTVPAITMLATAVTFVSAGEVGEGTVVCTAGDAPSPLGTITAVTGRTPMFKTLGTVI